MSDGAKPAEDEAVQAKLCGKSDESRDDPNRVASLCIVPRAVNN